MLEKNKHLPLSMSELNSGIIRGEFYSSGIFWLFFILHIVFAAKDLLFLFNLVVIMIFITSHFHSILVLYFSKLNNNLGKISVVKKSTIISIIYSTGYWYAVNDMQVAIWIFAMGLLPFLISILVIRYWITDN